MSRLLKINDDRGYTLIESMFQLVIFAVFMQLMLMFFQWKGPIEDFYGSRSSRAWEMFAVDLQNELVEVRDMSVHQNGRGIKFMSKRGQVHIEQNNSVIRKTIDGAGHIPFLTEVSSATFILEETRLFVSARMQDGSEKARDFEVGYYSE